MQNKNNEQIDSEVEEKPLQTPGIMLRKARRDQGLSEEEVCDQLGLTSRLFRALESDDLSRLPAPIYVRGYIRRYATLVDVSCEEVIESFESYYKEVVGEPEPVKEVEFGKTIIWKRRFFWLAIAGVLLILMLWFAWLFSGPTEASTYQQADSVPVTEVSSFAKGMQSLPMQFDRTGWAEVVDSAGDILFADMVTPGLNVTVTGMPPFNVRLSDQKGVKISYEAGPVEVK